MAEQQQQPEGCFPRLNAAMVQSGNFMNTIVSVVGKAQGSDGVHVKFQCSDGGFIRLNTEHCELPPNLTGEAVVEAVGQPVAPDEVLLFVTRELTPDTDLEIYNKMLMVQHNPKFAQYFVSSS